MNGAGETVKGRGRVFVSTVDPWGRMIVSRLSSSQVEVEMRREYVVLSEGMSRSGESGVVRDEFRASERYGVEGGCEFMIRLTLLDKG